MEKKIVKEHIQEDTIQEYSFYPEHEMRVESAEFKKSKERLKKDGNYQCWICGTTEKCESHHILEWAFSNDLSMDKATEILKTLDFYGYNNSDEFKDKPLDSLDSVRNQLILCDNHHRHKLCGLHHLSFPLWLSQKSCKDGLETVPQNEEDLIKEEIKLGIPKDKYSINK